MAAPLAITCRESARTSASEGALGASPFAPTIDLPDEKALLPEFPYPHTASKPGSREDTEATCAVPVEDSPPSNSGDVLVTGLLERYLGERAEKVMAGERIRYAMMPLANFWAGKIVVP